MRSRPCPTLGDDLPGVKLCFVEALEAAFEAGDTAKVEELLATIESLRPGERPPLLEAHAHRFRAKLTGDEAGSGPPQALFRELGLPFSLAVTLLEHGEATAATSALARRGARDLRAARRDPVAGAVDRASARGARSCA